MALISILVIEGRYLKPKLSQLTQSLALSATVGFLSLEATFFTFYDTTESFMVFRSKSALLALVALSLVTLFFSAWTSTGLTLRTRNIMWLFFINGQLLVLSNTLLFLLVVVELLSYLLVLFFITKKTSSSSAYLLNYLAFSSVLNILLFLVLAVLFASTGTTYLPFLAALKTPFVRATLYLLLLLLLMKIGAFPMLLFKVYLYKLMSFPALAVYVLFMFSLPLALALLLAMVFNLTLLPLALAMIGFGVTFASTGLFTTKEFFVFSGVFYTIFILFLV